MVESAIYQLTLLHLWLFHIFFGVYRDGPRTEQYGIFRIDGLLSLGLDDGNSVRAFHANRELQHLFVNNRAVPRRGELPKLLNDVVLRGLANETKAKVPGLADMNISAARRKVAK